MLDKKPHSSKEECEAYFAGMQEGIRLYAVWRDGEQFVGVTNTPLNCVLDDVMSERDYAMTEYQPPAQESEAGA